ncbi:hypothetical protein [Polyangium spumosum]|uniref:Uncharacterized protein n=1 Tax=Polyangium spumosum TaxID=889282 RepID=A0A6N7PV22_9BACT|nr:hypothetical protein [Polyangium spumosum]MRG95759.1 hypothetical protein [Polyangium spumosum]
MQGFRTFRYLYMVFKTEARGKTPWTIERTLLNMRKVGSVFHERRVVKRAFAVFVYSDSLTELSKRKQKESALALRTSWHRAHAEAAPS